MVERRRPQEGTGSQGPKPADKSKLPPLEERREHTIEPGTTNEQAQAANASSTDDVVADLEQAVRDKKARVEAAAPVTPGNQEKVIGLADSDAGGIGLADSGAPIDTKPKTDPNTAEGLTEILSEKIMALSKGDKKSITGKPRIHYVPNAEEGKSGTFVVLAKKEVVATGPLKKLGFNKESKLSPMKVESWNVSATIMKNIDPEGKMEASELGEKIRVKGKAKPSDFNGMEFASVSGDWDKGFTISNVVGASRGAIFGKEDGGSIDKETSKASAAFRISEKHLRDAMTGKNQIKTYERDELIPEIPEGGLDMAGLIAAERSAPGVMQEDHSPVVKGEGSSGGLLKRFGFGGKGGGKGR